MRYHGNKTCPEKRTNKWTWCMDSLKTHCLCWHCQVERHIRSRRNVFYINNSSNIYIYNTFTFIINNCFLFVYNKCCYSRGKKDNQMSTDSDSSPVYYSIMPNKGAHRLVRRQWASRWIYDGLCHTASVAMEPWLPSMAKEHCCRLLAGTHHAGGRKLSWPEWLATD